MNTKLAIGIFGMALIALTSCDKDGKSGEMSASRNGEEWQTESREGEMEKEDNLVNEGKMLEITGTSSDGSSLTIQAWDPLSALNGDCITLGSVNVSALSQTGLTTNGYCTYVNSQNEVYTSIDGGEIDFDECVSDELSISGSFNCTLVNPNNNDTVVFTNGRFEAITYVIL